MKKRIYLPVLALLFVVAFASCRSVNDTITGADVTDPARLSGRSACIGLCDARFHAVVRAENERHRLAIQSAEDIRKACKKICYNEGGN